MSDYNVTCPDFRYCEVKHRYANPCEIWDCDACWWGYDNCTATPEGPSDECPYIKKCYDLPRPHSHTAATVLSVLGAISVVGLGLRYVYRRYRRRAELAAADRQDEEEHERTPLLLRCRQFLSPNNTDSSTFERFRAVIFGARADVSPPEVLGFQEGYGQATHEDNEEEERQR